MGEAEIPSMEHEAARLNVLAVWLGVDFVAEDGGFEGFHVNADLVSAACVEVAFDERGAVFCGREDFVIGDGGFAGGVWDFGHLEAIDRMAANTGLEAAAFLNWCAFDKGEVFLGKAALREGFGQGMMGSVGLGNDDAAAGVLVEAMDDAGT